MIRITSFPLVAKGKWVFKTSITDTIQILILAFGPEQEFQIRFFTDEVEAKAYIDAVSNRIV
jgi:hypothetical protein